MKSILAAILVGIPIAAHAAGVLSETQARAKAIAILKGDPYGKTAQEVAKNIKEVQLIAAGTSNCGDAKVSKPVWQFHVVVPPERMTNGNSAIDGWLVLDGSTGKMTCAGLPFLD